MSKPERFESISCVLRLCVIAMLRLPASVGQRRALSPRGIEEEDKEMTRSIAAFGVAFACACAIGVNAQETKTTTETKTEGG